MSPPPSTGASDDSSLPNSGGGKPDYTKVGYGAMGDVTVNHTEVHHKAGPSQTSVIGVALLGVGLVAFAILRQSPTVNVSVGGNQQTVVTKVPETLVMPSPAPALPKPAASPAPAVLAAPSSVPPLRIQFDRPDRLYYAGDRQSVSITVPRKGYLYVASVWANGEMRLLCHPDWLTPEPGPVEAGRTIEIPAVNMSFTPPQASDVVTEEEVRAILSDRPISSLPADRHADVNQAWRALGFPVQPPSIRYRGGQLPDPESSSSAQGTLQATAAYRMKKGARGGA